MRLFDRGKKAKQIHEYKMLEPIKVNIEEAIRNNDSGYQSHCGLIADSPEYSFYSYEAHQDNSGGYVLRRSKRNPGEIVFFGYNKSLSCIFNGCLFQADYSGERGTFFIQAKNVSTGETVHYDWLGKGNLHRITPSGFGRTFCQDSIENMFVEEDKLIFNVNRKKSRPLKTGSDSSLEDEYNYDTSFRLIVTYENNEYKSITYFPTTKEESIRRKYVQILKVLNKRQCELDRYESEYASHKYSDYVRIAIAIKADGDAALDDGQIDKAIEQYRKAIFVEPEFAEAWVGIGNAYGIKEEYYNAIVAFNKAIDIDPDYGKALFGKAIILRKIGKVEEAMVLAGLILDICNDDQVEKFITELSQENLDNIREEFSMKNTTNIEDRSPLIDIPSNETGMQKQQISFDGIDKIEPPTRNAIEGMMRNEVCFCYKCGEYLRIGANFCPKCGTPIE